MTVSRVLAVLAALIIPATAMAESIEGEVDFTGKAPAPGKLHREADPFCAKKPMTDPSVLVKSGKLENVWVHVTKGAKETAKVPDKVVEMDQKDCMYEPRMTTAVVGQKIQAKNGDPVLHNVHTYAGSATLFNKGMPNDKAAPIEYAAKEEGMMKWKCDVHPWMRGYIGVSKSGLQAVTGADGSFKIDNVPPGKYTIESWHEKYGTKTEEVTVEAGKPAKVKFSYAGTEKGGA
ncbi:MAG TPA: carboxypeptidase regulatory-like domain-containing protein [Myxococcales bacterium]|jgi:plastocyanin|nr:carboxypeptidase regulatory-like domain-containing protein [Myxococcales bacterium]